MVLEVLEVVLEVPEVVLDMVSMGFYRFRLKKVRRSLYFLFVFFFFFLILEV